MSKRSPAQNGFTLVESLVGIALCSGLIAACLMLAGAGGKTTAKKLNSTRAFLAGQNFTEDILVSTNTEGFLDEGAHGPQYFDYAGRRLASGTGPIALSWNVTLNDPVQNIAKVDVKTTWKIEGIDQSRTMTIYRKIPVQSSSVISEIVGLPTPTPPPPPVPPVYAWNFGWPAPVVCQTGTQTKPAVCVDTANGGVQVADSCCTSNGLPKPAGQIVACTPVPFSYYWELGTPGPCGANLKAWRGVACRSSWQDTYDDSVCITNVGPKPSNVIDCVDDS